MSYPIATNETGYTTRLPIVIDVSSRYHLKAINDRLLSENKINEGLNKDIPWGSDKSVTTYTLTQIQNKLPSLVGVPSPVTYDSDNQNMGSIVDNELLVKLPLFDIPDRLGRYIVRVEYTDERKSKYCSPMFELVNPNNKQNTKVLFIGTHFSLDNPEVIANIDNQKTDITNRRVVIDKYNAGSYNGEPIKFEFTRTEQTTDFYGLGIMPYGDNGNKFGFVRRFIATDYIAHHRQISGVKPTYFNLGRNFDIRNYRSISHNLIIENVSEYSETLLLNLGAYTPENAKSVFSKYNTVENQEKINSLLNLNYDYLSLSNGANFGGFGRAKTHIYPNIGWYTYLLKDNLHHPSGLRKIYKNSFIYEWLFPREYGLKGIKFHDLIHDYRIDTVTIPTGRGQLVFDRFRVQLIRPIERSVIEITREPTVWEHSGKRVRITTARGYIDSGSPQYGRYPKAYEQPLVIDGEFPPGVEITRHWIIMSSNTDNGRRDPYIGWGFLMKWPFGTTVKYRLLGGIDGSLHGEEESVRNVKFVRKSVPVRPPDTDPNQINMAYNPNHTYEIFFVEDRSPSIRSLAARYRNADNRWSSEILPISLEIEFYI